MLSAKMRIKGVGRGNMGAWEHGSLEAWKRGGVGGWRCGSDLIIE